MPTLQQRQIQEAGSAVLTMSTAGESTRSIAVELALLHLRELEPLIAEDPELLVSTETVLAFATIRNADPATWQSWKRVLRQVREIAADGTHARRTGRGQSLRARIQCRPLD